MPCYYPDCKVKDQHYSFGRLDSEDRGPLRSCARHGARTVANLKAALPLLVPGATVDDEGERFGSINLDPPPGYVWAANSCHHLHVDWSVPGGCYSSRDEERLMMAEAVMDAVERVRGGLAECDDPECDICHPESIEP